MAIEFILVFIVTAAISFLGSLQPGPVNMAVLHTALTDGPKRSLSVAIGGVIPEVVYSGIALWFSFLFLANEWINSIIHIVAMIFFAVAGIYLLWNRRTYNTKPDRVPKKQLFVFGLFAGMMNPMLFAFWLMILTVFNSAGLFNMQEVICQAAFIAGSAAGAFLLLWLIAWYADRKKTAIFGFLPAHPARITGIVFIILALWEAVKMIM